MSRIFDPGKHLSCLRSGVLLSFTIAVCLLFAPFAADAADDGIEKDVLKGLEQSKSIAATISVKLQSRSPIASELSRLRTVAEDIRISDLLIEERYKLRAEKVKSLGSKALARHEAMVEGYREALTEYLNLIDSLPSDGTVSQSPIDKLKTLLDKVLPKKKQPVIGSLPYKHLNYPSQQLTTAPSITPAYLGGNKTVSPDDTAATREAPISNEIAGLAQSLNWNPVSIYEYVKNNIETEWYWGCMKGAEETLHQKSGNDCDQAALLTALLRASGFPTRYVRGTIQFFPDIERAKNLVGLDDPAKTAEYFRKAGIPHKLVIQGGKIGNIQIEHVWVESQIPYSNYRGAIIDANGKTWLGLDTSIKVKGYTYSDAQDILSAMSLSTIRDEYLGLITTGTGSTPFELNQTPLEYLQSRITSELRTQNSQIAYADFLRTRVLIPEVLNILPASTQFTLIHATNEYTAIPDDLKHKVRFAATNGASNRLFDITLDAMKLSNQRIAVAFEPETIQDQEIIDSYGGLDNTPAYLVRLRPVLKVNGDRMIVAENGLSLGREYDLTIELMGASGVQGSEKTTNTQIIGNQVVIGIVCQKANVAQFTSDVKGKNAEQLLYEAALHYVDQWNRAEDELASLLHSATTRPIPAIATVGNVIDVTSFMGEPHGFSWKGVFVDAGLRRIETVGNSQQTADRDRLFMQLSSIQGSILENRIFEDDFKVASISTAKLLQFVNQGAGVGGQGAGLLNIDKSNIDAILPTLSVDDNIKEDLTNAVNQNSTVRIPQAEIVYQDWTGIGYIKENDATGEAGYMLSGMIAGGMTAWGKVTWPSDLQGVLSNTFTGPPNYDAASALYIQKLPEGDLQSGRVNTTLDEKLSVKVFDAKQQAVANVQVTFIVKAGNGTFSNAQASITTTTDAQGIAKVDYTLGKHTKDNATYRRLTTDANSTQVGENIIDAQLPSGTSITKPFTVYGEPGEAKHITAIYPPKGLHLTTNALSFAGFVSAAVQDKDDNPISNVTVTFTVKDAIQTDTTTSCPWSPNNDQKTYFISEGAACLANAPGWGQNCGVISQQTLTAVTDYTGAAVQIILGGAQNAIYTVNATASVSGPQNATEFEFRTYNTSVNCDGNPVYQLIASYSYAADVYGNNLNAGKTGERIPVRAKLYYLVDEAGNGHFDTKTDFLSSSLTFSGPIVEVSGISRGNGIFTADYPLAKGLNPISIISTATISTPAGPLTKTASANMFAYGVEIETQPIPLMMINDSGFLSSAQTITYTITPPEYQASTAFVLIYKDGNVVAQIPVEKHGTDTATISRGFQFDANSTYMAEVVLNYGTGVEIRGKKVDIPVARFKVLTDEATPKTADEIKFGRGDSKRPEKIYHMELQAASLVNNCTSQTGKITVIGQNGQQIAMPTGDGQSYAREYQLKGASIANGCKLQIIDTLDSGSTKNKLIVSNRARADLDHGGIVISDIPDMAVLYGGLGNKVLIEISGTKTALPIEPVGVIVLGIDGLRQDVLYAQPGSSGDDVKASYADTSGCGESKNCYVQPTKLKGLCDVLGGKYDSGWFSSSCDPTGWENRHIKLPNVTAIFPSITLASWASIFSGKMPNETGITGNEFFARDLSKQVPPKFENPAGMITFDSGAFKGYDDYNLWNMLMANKDDKEYFFVPYQFDWQTHVTTDKTPQNDREIYKPDTVFETISSMAPVSSYFTAKDGNPVVVANSQYARGAYWLTWDVELSWNSSRTLDKASWGKLEDYLGDGFIAGKYDKYETQGDSATLVRNTVPFSALTVWYLPGLDHEAHLKGMTVYQDYFKDITDDYIKELVARLKKLDEFDNKIFIIVADHGHTQMPMNLKFKMPVKTYDPANNPIEILQEFDADTSCKLNLDFGSADDPDAKAIKAEQANNNLHIWELAEVFKAIGKSGSTQYKVLAPQPIAKLYTGIPYGATSNINNANIIAALNGPMAHIYLKSTNGWSDENPDIVQLSKLAQDIKNYIMDGGVYIKKEETKKQFKNLLSSVDRILIRVGGVYKDFNGVQLDASDNVIGPNAATITETYFDANAYISAFNRIDGMNHLKRSGDIVLIMKDVVGIPAGDSMQNYRYTTGVACKSWHGSLNRSDSYVPLIVAYPGGNKLEMQSLVDKTPGCNSSTGCDGNWRVTDLIQTIVQKQYSTQWEVR